MPTPYKHLSSKNMVFSFFLLLFQNSMLPSSKVGYCSDNWVFFVIFVIFLNVSVNYDEIAWHCRR